MRNIFVYGAGGHAKVVLDALATGSSDFRVAFVVDDDPAHHGSTLTGVPIRSPGSIRDERGFIAIGSNEARAAIARRYRGRLITVFHRTATLARGVEVGEGTTLLAGTIVNAGAKIGENVIVNTAASVGHDSVVEDGVHLGPGVRLCGHVRVGEGSFLGAGTIVTPGVTIGRNVFVHAAGRVTRDVPEGTTVRYPG